MKFLYQRDAHEIIYMQDYECAKSFSELPPENKIFFTTHLNVLFHGFFNKIVSCFFPKFFITLNSPSSWNLTNTDMIYIYLYWETLPESLDLTTPFRLKIITLEARYKRQPNTNTRTVSMFHDNDTVEEISWYSYINTDTVIYIYIYNTWRYLYRYMCIL